MWRVKHLLCALAAALALASPSRTVAQDSRKLSMAEFQKLQQLLQPAAEEAWQRLPWKLSVLEAQTAAAKEKKPIFMLVRSGHPLGCV